MARKVYAVVRRGFDALGCECSRRETVYTRLYDADTYYSNLINTFDYTAGHGKAGNCLELLAVDKVPYVNECDWESAEILRSTWDAPSFAADKNAVSGMVAHDPIWQY